MSLGKLNNVRESLAIARWVTHCVSTRVVGPHELVSANASRRRADRFCPTGVTRTGTRRHGRSPPTHGRKTYGRSVRSAAVCDPWAQDARPTRPTADRLRPRGARHTVRSGPHTFLAHGHQPGASSARSVRFGPADARRNGGTLDPRPSGTHWRKTYSRHARSAVVCDPRAQDVQPTRSISGHLGPDAKNPSRDWDLGLPALIRPHLAIRCWVPTE